MTERCKCGDPDCSSCGRAMGTYREREEPDTDELYEKARQEEVDRDPPPDTIMEINAFLAALKTPQATGDSNE